MNCLEFRRALTADPFSKDTEMRNHASTCGACATAWGQQIKFEQSLRQAIEVNTPNELAARILLRHSHGERQTRTNVQRRWLALAASVLLTVGVASGLWTFQTRGALRDAVLAEVYNELRARESRDVVTVAHVNDVWQPIATAIDKHFGTIRFVSRCPIRSSYGGHLIVPGKKGPVSVIVMPDEKLRFSMTVHDQRFVGMIAPTTHGSIAVVGSPGEDLATIEARARAALRYRF